MSSVPKSTHIKGSQWYQQGTVRAVNQGLGRVIRNRTDYGMIFMLDKRYSYRDNLKNFPEWTIKSQKIIDDCGKPFFKSIRSFY